MGLSETIIAATIGAAATVTTALFQLFSAIRANSKADSKPRRGSTARSVAAVVALMIASAVGGFLFSEFRQERTAQNMNSMREELNAKLQSLAATTERLAAASLQSPGVTASSQLIADGAGSHTASVESVVFAPACAQEQCSEESGSSLALCGAIPVAMQVSDLHLFVAAMDAVEPARAQFDEDVGGAKFVGPAVEHPQGTHKAVCVAFKHWSQSAHLARMIVHYGPAKPSIADSAPTSLMATDTSNPVAVVRNTAIDAH